jgi:LysM repeat protein
MKTNRLLVRVFLILNLVGWILFATVATVHAAPPQQGGARYHTVMRGQTLGAIAAQYRVSLGAVVRANGIQNPNRIYAGQRLVIPTGSASPPAARSSPPSGSCTHRIAWGDTLSRIASRYGVTVASLMSANGLTATRIIAGRTLRVCGGSGSPPAPAAPRPVSKRPTGTTVHRVRSGNTLSSIALLYHTSVQNIMKANGLNNPHHIYIGQSLSIPGR